MYKTLWECVQDLERNGHLIRIKEEVDPNLQMAEIQRRVFQAKGPAIFFENIKGSAFPAVSNLFGTIERAQFIFRDTLDSVKKIVQAKANPNDLLKKPFQNFGLIFDGKNALPKKVSLSSAKFREISISQLPQIVSWPKDGGPFITLPQVFSRDPENENILKSNLGMYRVQLAGNEYKLNEQVGMHYQIHRGIGVHHTKALQKNQPLKVSIFIGGPPAHTFAAVMPLPEGLPEVAFAGVLAGRRFRYFEQDGYTISADTDFCITGTIENQTLPEGPFGDHLGYYSLKHDFPVLKVEKVYARENAIWPFTVVGRPPQEDTIFGDLVHEMTGPMIPETIPGLKAVHAVDAAGVHPLLLAIGSERYTPYQVTEPKELLTTANAILGFGQLSLAKYLIITETGNNLELDIHNIPEFFLHVLRRVRWQRDLHFQTETTMDTLDYSAQGINKGSKVVIAAAGEAIRKLSTKLSGDLKLPNAFHNLKLILPGILAIEGPEFQTPEVAEKEMQELTNALEKQDLEGWPLIVITNDSKFLMESLNNFLWVTFTCSNPATDIYGVNSFIMDKHWGCTGPLIIDARIKPHHAPPLESDPDVVQSVNALAEKGKSLYKII